ncbi:MAG: FeoA family protein [Proteobacteria bacterium]|jgi:ferrous iron transport protein A|nr:FeoA family protein [Pseudomonadota bacterium]MDA1302264.1 FeoA family protein [Pseudomonadota bacterium]
MSLTLADVNQNEACKVIRAGAHDAELQSRLYALGLYPGVEVEILRVAPAGDPFQVRTRSSLLSIRRSEAALIEVERL